MLCCDPPRIICLPTMVVGKTSQLNRTFESPHPHVYERFIIQSIRSIASKQKPASYPSKYLTLPQAAEFCRCNLKYVAFDESFLNPDHGFNTLKTSLKRPLYKIVPQQSRRCFIFWTFYILLPFFFWVLLWFFHVFIPRNSPVPEAFVPFSKPCTVWSSPVAPTARRCCRRPCGSWRRCRGSG